MTSVLIQDFTERSKEVSKYFVFLKNLEQETIKLTMIGKNNKQKSKAIDSELLKTLKASGFLLLYNLVEATMRNVIEAIFDELRSKTISYNQIRPELKKVVLKNLGKQNDKIYLAIAEISVDIITVGFDKEKLFSGNIDGKKIRSTADEYGFSHVTDYAKTGGGKDLLTIKNNRNQLAHGLRSFTEVGRDKTTDELLEIKNKVIQYLKQIIQNTETYLENTEYLDVSTRTTP
jgi:MAE_28990/MAE_18760-like HEPN